MLETVSLLNGINEKMAYLNQRQKVLAKNISNADTPGYRPQDIKTPDFASTMGKATGTNGMSGLSLTVTQPGHINGLGQGTNGSGKAVAERKTYEVSPTGNAVDLEEQMMKSSKTNMDYQMMTNLYSKNLGLMRTAMRSQH